MFNCALLWALQSTVGNQVDETQFAIYISSY